MEEDLVDKQEPFFSVVMPSYNRSTFIKESISSVLAQEFLDFELIFVDDGSVDDTKQLVEDIIKLDSRVRYFFQENKERGAARNTGIKRSLGKYVLFFDSDDFMLPTYLSTLHKWIVHLNHPNLIAAKYNIQRANKHYPSSVTTMSAGWYDINLLVKGTPFGCFNGQTWGFKV